MRPHLNHFTRPPRPPVVGDIAQQLRDLPSEATPPYDFAEFRRRSRERSAPKRQLVSWPHAAAAAGLTAFVAAMALLGTRGPASNDEIGPAHASSATAAVAPGHAEDSLSGAATANRNAPSSPTNVSAADGNSASSSASVANKKTAAPPASAADDASDQARAAREWLARHAAEPALVRAGPHLTVASLEDRIAWFDDALTDRRLHGANPAQLKVLQTERARLVSSLAQVRYAEALVADGS